MNTLESADLRPGDLVIDARGGRHEVESVAPCDGMLVSSQDMEYCVRVQYVGGEYDDVAQSATVRAIRRPR